MDFINLMAAASKLLSDDKISRGEWNLINAIAASHDWN